MPEETHENQVTRQDPRNRDPEEGKVAKRTYSIEACTAKMDWPCHKNNNCKKESAHKVAKINATKTPLKPHLRISIFQLSLGNRLLRIEQSGIASLTKVPPNLKQRESVKLKGSVKKGKQEPRGHYQTRHSPNSLALFATDSLELKLAYTAINEHTDTHKHLIFRI